MKKAKKERLVNDVSFLTSVYPPRNHEHPNSLMKVTKYVEDELGKLGLTVEYQSWTVNGTEYSNVIYQYLPDKQKRLVIGAHYDVCMDTPGADDNASAVAGLLETIRLVNSNALDLTFGIDFVFYCLEEPPYFGTEFMGSYIHAQSIAANKENILGMICYEMIGYFSDEPGSQKFPHPDLEKIYPNTGNFIMAVSNLKYQEFNDLVYRGMRKNENIDVHKANLPSYYGLAGMSDQRNYWQFNIPAMMVNDTSFLRNPNYHLSTDTIDTLNFEKMSEVVNCVIESVKNMSAELNDLDKTLTPPNRQKKRTFSLSCPIGFRGQN
jgi:hypothetical protein